MNIRFVKIFMIAVGISRVVQTNAVDVDGLPGFERWEVKDEEGVSTTIQICIRTVPVKNPTDVNLKNSGIMWIEHWDRKTKQWNNIETFYREKGSQEEASTALRKDAEEFVRESYTHVKKIYSDWEQ
jgi:hypothetical protein